MGKKIIVEFKDAARLQRPPEIARLMKEPPEELLERAFKEWVQLREDLEDAAYIEEALEEYEREGWRSSRAGDGGTRTVSPKPRASVPGRVSRRAQRQLRSLPKDIVARIGRRIGALACDPRPRGALKLTGARGHSIGSESATTGSFTKFGMMFFRRHVRVGKRDEASYRGI